MFTLVPQIFIPSYPGYLYPRTPDIYTLVPQIFIPSYPGYLYPFTPDNAYSRTYTSCTLARFAASSSVVDDDEIQIQGDQSNDIGEFIVEKFPQVCDVTIASSTSTTRFISSNRYRYRRYLPTHYRIDGVVECRMIIF